MKKSKKIISTLLAILLLLTLLPIQPIQGNATDYSLTLDETLNIYLEESNPYGEVTFTPNQSGFYTFYLTGDFPAENEYNSTVYLNQKIETSVSTIASNSTYDNQPNISLSYYLQAGTDYFYTLSLSFPNNNVVPGVNLSLYIETQSILELSLGTPTSIGSNGDLYEGILKEFVMFVPSESGYYNVYATGDYHTCVELYQLIDTGLKSLDESKPSEGNFSLCWYLEAGKSYYFHVGKWLHSDKNYLDDLPYDVFIEKVTPLTVDQPLDVSLERNVTVRIPVSVTTSGTYIISSINNNNSEVRADLFMVVDENFEDINSSGASDGNFSMTSELDAGSIYYIILSSRYATDLQLSMVKEDEVPDDVPNAIVMRLNSVKALLKGEEIAVDPTNKQVSPFTLNGKTMVPVRFVENLDAEVKYNGATKPVTVTYGDIQLTLEFGKDTMTRVVGDGEPETITLPTAPSLVEGKTCVPIREVAEGIGFSVKYESHVIVVSTDQLTEDEQAEFIELGKKNLPAFIEGVKSISTSKTEFSLKAGKNVQIEKSDIIFTPTKVGCDSLVYSSDNEAVATVTSKGKINAISKGTAKITISSHNGKKVVVSITVT